MYWCCSLIGHLLKTTTPPLNAILIPLELDHFIVPPDFWPTVGVWYGSKYQHAHVSNRSLNKEKNIHAKFKDIEKDQNFTLLRQSLSKDITRYVIKALFNNKDIMAFDEVAVSDPLSSKA